MAGDLVMRHHGTVERAIDIENARNGTQAGKDAVLLGENGSGSALAGIDAGVAGRIARSPVFEQSVLDDGGYATAVKVHEPVVGRWSLVVGRWQNPPSDCSTVLSPTLGQPPSGVQSSRARLIDITIRTAGSRATQQESRGRLSPAFSNSVQLVQFLGELAI